MCVKEDQSTEAGLSCTLASQLDLQCVARLSMAYKADSNKKSEAKVEVNQLKNYTAHPPCHLGLKHYNSPKQFQIVNRHGELNQIYDSIIQRMLIVSKLVQRGKLLFALSI